MTYPKKITIDNEKLKKLITEKSELVNEGRSISIEIEKLEKDMEELNVQIAQIEKTVNIEEFHEEERKISEEVNKAIERMKAIQQEIYNKIKDFVPKEMGDEYDELKKKKEALEEKRNKIALKAQKFNDKIIPLGRKVMKPFLEDAFDDYDSIRLDNGEIVCTIFNHLEDFKANFKK